MCVVSWSVSMPASSRIRAISLPRRMTERVSSCVRSVSDGSYVKPGSGVYASEAWVWTIRIFGPSPEKSSVDGCIRSACFS